MHSPKLPMDSVKASILAQILIILKYSIMFRCFVSSCVLLSAQPPRSVLYSTVSSKYLGDDWIILSNIPSYSTASAKYMKMSEHSENATEKIMSSIMDTIADKLPKQKSGHFDPGSVSEKVKSKLFGRQRSLHGVLGGGKSADVLLWRNKKISSSVLALATAIWVFFEWLDYHFLTIISFSLVLGMVVQFVWSNFSSRLSGSSNVPRVELPDELFVNIAVAIGAQVNKFLSFLQDVSCERNLKHFVLAIVGLWAAAVAGSWFNFLTVIYIGFVCAHTLPVLYEKYDDQIDDFLYSILGLLRDQYQKLDQGVLSRIPKGNMKLKKSE